jgi:hypothetical protein
MHSFQLARQPNSIRGTGQEFKFIRRLNTEERYCYSEGERARREEAVAKEIGTMKLGKAN